MKSFGCALEVNPLAENADDRAKLELAKALKSLLEALIADEDFWVVKDTTGTDPIGGKRYIGWRIDVPHMEDSDG